MFATQRYKRKLGVVAIGDGGGHAFWFVKDLPQYRCRVVQLSVRMLHQSVLHSDVPFGPSSE